MATLSDIVAKGVLELFELPQWESRLAIHPLYAAPELFDWVAATPELHSPKFAVGRRTLAEHLEQTFCDFRCSERPPAGNLRRMTPTKHGIWKLHPPSLRVYGFCPNVRTFAAITAAQESETKKDKSLNDKKLDEVRKFIKDHDLSETVIVGDILAVFPV
jgi:hypothetical protein